MRKWTIKYYNSIFKVEFPFTAYFGKSPRMDSTHLKSKKFKTPLQKIFGNQKSPYSLGGKNTMLMIVSEEKYILKRGSVFIAH